MGSLSDIAAVERRIAELIGAGRPATVASLQDAAAFGRLVDRALPGPVAAGSGATSCIVPVAALEGTIARACAANGTDPALVKAIVANESGFDAAATSNTGAQGLMQLMPATAADAGIADAYDPQQNVAGGTRYLGTLLQHFGGNVPLAVAAYNAGPGAVERGEIGPETRSYVRNVLASYARYRGADEKP